MAKYANFSSPENVKAKLQRALYYARKKRKARLNAGSGNIVLPIVTFNPSDKGSNVVLSDGNLTVTYTASAWKSARTTLSRSTGKFYFEIEFTHTSGSFVAGGIGTSSANLENYVGNDANGIGLVSNGSSFTGAKSVAVTAGFANGQVLSVAVDMDAGKVWFRHQSDAWNSVLAGLQDPATGDGGISISISTIFPMASLQSVIDIVKGRFKSSDCTQAIPSGFLYWNGEAGSI